MDEAEAQAAAMSGGSFKSRAQTFKADTRYASVSSSLSAALDRLASPENVAHVLRSAAHAAAKVMYAELQLKVPVKKGLLKESLFRWFDTKRSTPIKQIYLVGPNKRLAGHWANVEFGHFRYNRYAWNGKWKKSLLDKGVKEGKTQNTKGQWHGGPGALDKPKWVVPHPYLRPAWEAQKKNVVIAMRKRANVRLREVIRGQLWADAA
jgi:hypothetical protein